MLHQAIVILHKKKLATCLDACKVLQMIIMGFDSLRHWKSILNFALVIMSDISVFFHVIPGVGMSF